MGIEPTSSAWKAEVLPLNYTRKSGDLAKQNPASQPDIGTRPAPLTRHSQTDTHRPGIILIWWRGEDLNLRRLSRQIYSLIPLTTREPLQKMQARYCVAGAHGCQQKCAPEHQIRTTHPWQLYYQFRWLHPMVGGNHIFLRSGNQVSPDLPDGWHWHRAKNPLYVYCFPITDC